MLKKILPYGLVAGLIAGTTLSASTIYMMGHTTSSAWGMAVGYLMMLLALSLVFVAIKRHRDEAFGGVIRFWPAFGMGLGISAVAGVCYVLIWETAQAITHMDFASDYARMLIEQKKAEGLSGEALAAFSAEMEQFKLQYANPLFRLPMTFAEIFPVGVLVSLVSAALLCRSTFWPAARK